MSLWGVSAPPWHVPPARPRPSHLSALTGPFTHLPPPHADTHTQVVEYFDDVTIYFSDLVGYTSACSSMHPLDLFKMLNELYSGFDLLVQKHGVSKVETIGDAYFVIGGAPDRSVAGPAAAARVAAFALDALDFVESFMAEREKAGLGRLQMRAGMASGSCVAGVLGKTVPKFSYWGDTVNLASRMVIPPPPVAAL